MKVFRRLLVLVMGIGLLSGISWAQDEGLENDAGTQQNQETPAPQEDTQAPEAPVEQEAPTPPPSSEQTTPEPSAAPQEELPQQEAQPAQEPAPEQAQPAAAAQEQPAAPQPTEAPAPAAPQEQQPEASVSPDELVGLDTADLEDPQGNWLFKRVWWERAEQKYEKIRAIVTQIMEQRSGFFVKRTELEKNVLDPFYVETGFSLGELLQKITDSIDELKSEVETHASDSQEFDKLEQDKKDLEDLRAQVETVVKQDEAVNKALLQFVDQINKLRHYEQQAWQDFKDIARVLDDKKARELFYKIDNAWQNIQKIQEYVEQTFSSSFEALVTDVSKQIERIKSSVAELKERGIVLHIAKQTEGEQEQEEPKERGFFGTIFEVITSSIRDMVNMVIAVIRWPFDRIFGGNKQVEENIVEGEQPAISSEDEQPAAEADQDMSQSPQTNSAQPMQQMPTAPMSPSQDSSMQPIGSSEDTGVQTELPAPQVDQVDQMDIAPEHPQEEQSEPADEQSALDYSERNETESSADTE